MSRSALFEDIGSGYISSFLLDRVLLEGDSWDSLAPFSDHEAPLDWASYGSADKHPDIRGQDVWMGSPDRSAQLSEFPGALSPLPITTLRPPTPQPVCVSPQDIFSACVTLDDEDDVEKEEDYPPPSPLSPSSSTSETSFFHGQGTLLSTPARSSDALPLMLQASPVLSLDWSPRSQKRKNSDDDEGQEPTKTPPRTRRRSTASPTDGSDEEDWVDVEPAVRSKSVACRAAPRRRKSESRVICKDCGQDFGRAAELTRHKKSSCPARPSTSDGASPESTHQCDRCGKPLSRSDALVRHLRSPGGCAKYLASLNSAA